MLRSNRAKDDGSSRCRSSSKRAVLFTDLGDLSSKEAPPADAGAGDADASAADAAATDSAASPDGDAASCVRIDGMQTHLPFDANTIDGGKALDVSGNGNNATFVGTPPAVVPGKIGDALAYPTATIGRADIPGVELDVTPNGMSSIAFWYERDYQADVAEYVVLMPASPVNALYLADSRLCFNTGIGECFGTDGVPLYDRWIHVVAVFNNGPVSEGTLYVDGQKRPLRCAGDCTNVRTAGAPLQLGGHTNATFRGKLDDVRFFGRALTDAEVTTLYEGRACP